MSMISRYRIILAVVLPFLILITIRSCTRGSFKYDAKRWAEPSFDFANVISESALGTLKGEKLIINLDSVSRPLADRSLAEVYIPPDSLLDKKFLSRIREHKGPVLITSNDPSLSARIWMLISQTGLRNLYILTSSNDNEVFKSEFRPDTLKPELLN